MQPHLARALQDAGVARVGDASLRLGPAGAVKRKRPLASVTDVVSGFGRRARLAQRAGDDERLVRDRRAVGRRQTGRKRATARPYGTYARALRTLWNRVAMRVLRLIDVTSADTVLPALSPRRR